jgi:UDP-galactopyranose mutase
LEHQVKLIDPDYEVVAYNFIEKAYVIQDDNTSGIILEVKEILRDYNIYLLGRFAEWQYYNVDKCMEAAATLSSQIEKDLYEKEN